jgi:hypothetical protein
LRRGAGRSARRQGRSHIVPPGAAVVAAAVGGGTIFGVVLGSSGRVLGGLAFERLSYAETCGKPLLKESSRLGGWHGDMLMRQRNWVREWQPVDVGPPEVSTCSSVAAASW